MKTTDAIQPKTYTWKHLLIGLLAVPIMIGGFMWMDAPPSPAVPAVAVNEAARTEPDEPCRVEAPASWRDAAQNWCEDGVFTQVHVKAGASSVTVVLQLSQKSARNFAANKFAVLNRFRGLADEMAKASDMNVAFSFHDPNGQMVGGCARDRSASESICR